MFKPLQGLRVEDEIIEFGSVNPGNFQNLQNIASVVQHSEGVSQPHTHTHTQLHPQHTAHTQRHTHTHTRRHTHTQTQTHTHTHTDTHRAALQTRQCQT